MLDPSAGGSHCMLLGVRENSLQDGAGGEEGSRERGVRGGGEAGRRGRVRWTEYGV